MPRNPGQPHGSVSKDVVRVVLMCGHIRRYFQKSPNDEYYCFECDEAKPIKERLKQDRRS